MSAFQMFLFLLYKVLTALAINNWYMPSKHMIKQMMFCVNGFHYNTFYV